VGSPHTRADAAHAGMGGPCGLPISYYTLIISDWFGQSNPAHGQHWRAFPPFLGSPETPLGSPPL